MACILAAVTACSVGSTTALAAENLENTYCSSIESVCYENIYAGISLKEAKLKVLEALSDIRGVKKIESAVKGFYTVPSGKPNVNVVEAAWVITVSGAYGNRYTAYVSSDFCYFGGSYHIVGS